MIITSIQQAKRDRERVNIFVDEHFWAGLDKQTLISAGFHTEMKVSAEQLQAALDQDRENFLYRKALALWARRPRSRRELEQKLSQTLRAEDDSGSAEVSTSVLNTVLSRLAAAGYSDREFAEWWVAERRRQGKYGWRRISSELAAKGVSSEILTSVASEDDAETTEAQAVSELLQKRFGVTGIKQIADLKERAKAYRYMRSRGF